MTTINAQINTSAKISAKSLVIGDVSKRSLGLDAVDNTSDLNKPISTAQQTAIDLKANQATTYTKGEVDTNIANLVDTAPAALDTLNELAAALGDDENFATTVNASIALKAPLASPNFTSGASIDGDTILAINAIGVDVQQHSSILDNTTASFTTAIALDVSLNTDDITTNAENIVAANEAIEDNAAEIAIVKSLNVGTLFFLNDGTTLGSFASGQLDPAAVPDNAVRADIGHAVTILGNSAFNATLGSGLSLNILTEVTIPTSVTEIQNSVFAYQKLTNIDIPNSVTSIGSQSFRANLLESLSISGSVTSIGNSAFKDNLLTAVTFAESLFTITKDITGDIVVVSGAGLGEANGTYTRPAGLLLTLQYELKDSGGNVLYEIIRGPFYEFWAIVRKSDSAIIYEIDTSNSSPTQTTLPLTGWSTTLAGLPSIAGLRIEGSAFENNLITELNIGTSVNIIGPSAFRDNDFTSIDIPSTVTSIGTSAFAVNTNLNTVTAFCPISAFSGTSIFANTVSALTIYVDVDDNSWDSLEALNPSLYQGIPAVTIQRIAVT